MLNRVLPFTFALALFAVPALAVSHEAGDGGQEHVGPPRGLIIFIPHDLTLYRSEPGDKPPRKEQMVDAFESAIDALDEDDDGLLSKDELKAAQEAAHKIMDQGGCGGEGDCGDGAPRHMPPHLVVPVEDVAPGDQGAAFDAVDGDGDGKLSLSEIGDAMKAFVESHGGPIGSGCGDEGQGGCSDGDRGEMMDPEWPSTECNGKTGNEVSRELTGAAGGYTVAISLPSGREAGCFSIESYAAIEVQIAEETNPPEDPAPVMWHSDDGEEALADLVLEEGIYHVEVINSNDENAAITVVFVDYSGE